jgi:hypothetical protein
MQLLFREQELQHPVFRPSSEQIIIKLPPEILTPWLWIAAHHHPPVSRRRRRMFLHLSRQWWVVAIHTNNNRRVPQTLLLERHLPALL